VYKRSISICSVYKQSIIICSVYKHTIIICSVYKHSIIMSAQPKFTASLVVIFIALLPTEKLASVVIL